MATGKSNALNIPLPEDNTILCACNQLTYGYLRKEISSNQVADLDQLQVQTQVGKSCGRCLEQFLQLAHQESPKTNLITKTIKKFSFCKVIRQAHFFSSLVACSFLLFFALTGWAMNHRDGLGLNEIESRQVETVFIDSLIKIENEVFLVEKIRELGARGKLIERDREDSSLAFTFHSSGSHCEAYIDLLTGKSTIQFEESALLESLNEIHRSQNHDESPSLFIDVMAILMTFVALSGMLIFFTQKNLHKLISWSILALGLIGPYLVFLQLH